MWRKPPVEDRLPEPGQIFRNAIARRPCQRPIAFNNRTQAAPAAHCKQYKSSRKTGKVFLLLFSAIYDFRPVIPPSSPSKSPPYPQLLADSHLNAFGGRMCSFPHRFHRSCPYSSARWTQAAGHGAEAPRHSDGPGRRSGSRNRRCRRPLGRCRRPGCGPGGSFPISGPAGSPR